MAIEDRSALVADMVSWSTGCRPGRMGWQAGIWLQLACPSDLVCHNRDIDKYVPTWYYDHRKHDVPAAGMVTQVHLPLWAHS